MGPLAGPGRWAAADLVGDQAVLDALGCARAQRVAGAVLVVAPVTVLGAALATVVAAAASPLMPIGVARLAEPDVGFDVDLLVLGAGALLVAVGVLVLAVASAVRVSALHPDGAGPGRRRLRRTAGPGGGPPAASRRAAGRVMGASLLLPRVELRRRWAGLVVPGLVAGLVAGVALRAE